MKFTIKETGKTETLVTMDENRIDWTEDLIFGASDTNFEYDSEAETYLISQEEFDWWKDYIENMESDNQEKNDLIETFGVDVVMEILEDAINNGNMFDYNNHHDVYQNAFEKIKSAYEPISE